MKSTLISKLTLLIFLFIGMTSCSKHNEELTLEKIYYATKANTCEDILKWIPNGNPNNSKYSTSSNVGLLTIEFKKSKFDKKNLAINENGKLVETYTNINSLVVDKANGDIYECTNGEIYLIDKGNYSKTLVVNSEELKTLGNYIINNNILYLTKRRNESKTIDIIEYNLLTNEHSILYTETRKDERIYYNPITYGLKNDKLSLSIHSADDKSRYIQTYSLEKNEIIWEADIGNVINSSRWLIGGKHFVDASFTKLKTYDMATGKLTHEMSLGDYNFVDILDDHAIVNRSGDAFRLINLENGNVTYQKEGHVIGNHNSILYSVNDDNQFEAYDLKTKNTLFCTNLNDIEESKNSFVWNISPTSRHIVGTINGCDKIELLVIKY